jgi:hypothetical protein
MGEPLLPCPFCGCYATMTAGQYYAVRCSDTTRCGVVTRVFTYERDAVRKWNARQALARTS